MDHEKIKASIERTFMTGFELGYQAALSGKYGPNVPPVEVAWDNSTTPPTPSFRVKREQIQVTSGLQLPPGYRRNRG